MPAGSSGARGADGGPALRYGVRCIEASAFINIRPSLVLFRLKGILSTPDRQLAPRRILAKVSRPEVAEAFLRPAPESILRQLVERGRLTAAEAELGSRIPVAEDICVEADSAGHTDQRVALTLLPAMFALRDRIRSSERYAAGIRVGAAGGIGSPHAAAAAFIMGADFILTGSINQCTVEAGTSDAVKDLLQDLNVQDTAYAPAGDMFETGARVQVVKKGLLFAARANKLYQLYLRHNSLDEIDEKNKAQIQERFFNRSFADAGRDQGPLGGRRPGEDRGNRAQPETEDGARLQMHFAHSTRSHSAASRISASIIRFTAVRRWARSISG